MAVSQFRLLSKFHRLGGFYAAEVGGNFKIRVPPWPGEGCLADDPLPLVSSHGGAGKHALSPLLIPS